MNVLFICFALFGSAYSDGYWDIILSPQTISTVPFFDGHISVWEHAKSPGRYYAMPLVFLNYESATVASNLLTGRDEMSFTVLMWSLEAQEVVYRHLHANVNPSIELDDVEMLPMEKIRIVWKDRTRQILSHFQLGEQWKSNTHLPTQVTFRFACSDRPKCEHLRQFMMNSPTMFDALELEYVINGQRSARRMLTVTSSHIVNGNLFSRLNNMPAAASNGDRYLTSSDLNTITSETVSNVVGSLITDTNYVDTGDEVTMKDVILNELKKHEVSSRNFQPHMWDSVFWDPTWARPDKLTSYLNSVLSKDSSDSRNFIVNERASSSNEAINLGGVYKMFGLNIGGSSSSGLHSRINKDDFLKTLRERHSDIEWTGEVFRVKPMKLYRLNLSRLRTTSRIASANIQVHRYEAVHSIKLRRPQAARNQTSISSPQLREDWLLAKIREMENRLTTHCAETSDRLKTQISETRSLLVNSWPIKHHFCIFGKGACPPGFVRHRRYAYADHASNRRGDEALGNFGRSRLLRFGDDLLIDFDTCCR